MQILLADDDVNVRSALKLLLEDEAGLKVVAEVENAPDLLAQVKEAHPRMILLDWELPAFQAKKQIPELKCYFPELIVVAMSGRPESRQSALAAGADAFISKGEAPEHLLAIIRELGFACKSTGSLPTDGEIVSPAE